MRAHEVRAARLLHRLEFHQLNPRQIRIEQIELPLPVSAHLGFLAPLLLPPMGFQKRLRFLHVHDAQRDVIQHTHQPQIRMLGMV